MSEFERERVPEKSLLGFKSFVGMFAGEHCAGTELMIGPLFVAAGVSAFSVLGGLFLGNILAVFTWLFLTAPIAVKFRYTLYYQLEKICGRKLVVLYNLANGVMFCFLAGSMVTVSATALGVWFKFPMPGLNDLLPNSISWCIAVLAVGAVIALVAATGYNAVVKFANIAAPWMVLIFFVFGIVAFRDLLQVSNYKVDSLSSLWDFANTVLWKGGEPLPGQVKFGFWHVTFYAWFCNLAMHAGMADLSVFRFAKKPICALATAGGVFIGHFFAWLSASLLYSYQLALNPADTAILPGPLAFRACGIAGLICIIIAGWTTANPTIYRAGLAFQAIMPNASRFKVTFWTGMIAAVAGVFPAFAMKLLDFVAIYGMILMPMGAVIFADCYLMKPFKLKSFYAEEKGISFSIAAAAAWLATLLICYLMVYTFSIIQIFFVSLPGWIIAVILYVVFSKVIQSERAVNVLKKPAFIAFIVSLIAIIVSAICYFEQIISQDTMKQVILALTIIYFVITPFIMSNKKSE